MQSFLRQRLMIMPAELVAKNSLMLLLFVYWTIHYTGLPEGNQLIQLLSNSMIVFFLISFCRINIFLVEQYESQCISIDFLLILSNVNSLSSFSSWKSLYSLKSSCDFLFKMFCFELLLQSRPDLILRMYWYSSSFCSAVRVKRPESMLSNCF